MPAASVPTIDTEKAIHRLMELLSISAPTGEEKPISEYLLRALAEFGVPAESVTVDDAPTRIKLPCQVGNVIVRLDGTQPGPRRLLSAHMDTVPLARKASPVIKGERIEPRYRTALGGDDRTGVAALLTAIAELTQRRLPRAPLTFLFTVREESGLRGARAVKIEDLARPELGFNFDGGLPNEVTLGATGAVKMEITIGGVAAHAGVHPERGVSAVAVFAAAAAKLDAGGWLGLVKKKDGTGTSNIGQVQGGEATNVITEKLVARAEARSHDAEFLKRLVEEYRRAFEESASSHRNTSGQCGTFEFEAEESYYSFKLDEKAPVTRAAFEAVKQLGLEPRTRLSNGGLDANWLVRHGVPTVSLGCGQHEIHTTEEYVMLAEYLNACRLALAVATG